MFLIRRGSQASIRSTASSQTIATPGAQSSSATNNNPTNINSSSSTNISGHLKNNGSMSAPISRSSSSVQLAADMHPPLKKLGLKFVNTRLRFLLVFSRGLSVLPSALGVMRCINEAWKISCQSQRALSSVNASEQLMAGIWCIVSGYLSYSCLDGLMVRWIVTYSTPAAIVRMLSCSALYTAMTQSLHSLFSTPEKVFYLHIWILISCILTLAYAVQNFVTSNLSLEKKTRSVDLINIAVFAVVPVGLASFLTMLGLLRVLMILRWDLADIAM